MVCSLPSAVLHAASLQQAALVNYFSQMLSFGHIQPFLPFVCVFTNLEVQERRSLASLGCCIKLWDITSLGSVQVVGFFDVAARLCAGDRPIAALVGGSSCSIGSALQHRVHLTTTKIISQYRLLTTALSNNVHESRKMSYYSIKLDN